MWKGDLLKAGIASDGVNIDIAGNLSVMGIPVVGTVFGNAYFVDYRNGADTNNGLTRDKAFKTLSAAIDAATTNNNDVIFIDGDSTVVETAMVSLTKNRVHIVGCNGPLGHYGAGAKVSCTLSTGATNIATFQNTGVRNNITGVKFMNSNTVAQGLYSVAEGGEFTRYFNCEFYKDSDLDETAAAELLHNGDSAMFYNCTFGSSANIIADNKIRPNVLLSATLSGKKCRDSYFENCLFLSKAGGTEHVAVYGANATDVERMLMFNGCTFLNNPLSAATPAHAVGFGNAQTEGAVFLKNCSSVDHTVMAQAAVGIYVDGAVPTFATTGVSKAS
jgi:hypothetical protein